MFILIYNIGNARKIFSSNGLVLDENSYKNTQTKMKCHDKDGFYYETSLDSLLAHKTPYKFHKSNRFTINNIQLILDRETDGVKIISDKYINSRDKLKFVCSCGNCFETNILQFVTDGKRYCNFCSCKKKYDCNDYTEEIRQKCEENNCTLLTDKISRVNEVFSYVCNYHLDKGIQHSNYSNYTKNKYGCKYCTNEYEGINHRIPKEEIIKILESKNFTYIKHEYPNFKSGNESKVKIYYVCNNHKNKGVQSIDLCNLKNIKKGCPYCCGRGRTKEDLQNEVDSLNSGIEIIEYRQYSDLTAECRHCGNVWKTMGSYLTSGHKCPKCCKSTYEKQIEKILINNGIKYIPQYKFDDCKDKLPLPFDFYIPEQNILIEVDGEGHYKPTNFRGMSDVEAQKTFESTKTHDKIKTDYCEGHNINLIRVPYFIFADKSIDLTVYLLSQINTLQ